MKCVSRVSTWYYSNVVAHLEQVKPSQGEQLVKSQQISCCEIQHNQGVRRGKWRWRQPFGLGNKDTGYLNDNVLVWGYALAGII